MTGWPMVEAWNEPGLDWGMDAPAPSLPADGFAAEIDGTMLSPVGGRYAFDLDVEGAARLWVGDRLLVDRWSESRVNETASVVLGPGVLPIHLEYRDTGGSASVRLTWSVEVRGRPLFLPALRNDWPR
jgi:hypothetical protein